MAYLLAEDRFEVIQQSDPSVPSYQVTFAIGLRTVHYWHMLSAYALFSTGVCYRPSHCPVLAYAVGRRALQYSRMLLSSALPGTDGAYLATRALLWCAGLSRTVRSRKT
eukprot:788895-Rhodomonas_salina.1